MSRRDTAAEALDTTPTPPRPRRAGWLVAAALVAGSIGLVVHWQRQAAPPQATPTTGDDTARAALATPEPSALPEPTSATPTSSQNVQDAPVPAAPAVLKERARGEQTEDALPVAELLHRANASLRHGDTRRAEQRYRLVLAKDPSNAEGHTGLGDVARRENDLARAREHYRRALATSPSYLPALIALADVEWDLGDHASAKSRYAVAVEKLGDRAPPKLRERAGMAGDGAVAKAATTP